MNLINIVKDLSRSTLVKFGFLYTLANGIQKGIGFLAFMYLAMILTVSDYATFGKYYALFAVISAASYAGIVELAISELSKHNTIKRRNSLFRLSNTLFSILAFISVLIVLSIKYLAFNNWIFSDILIVCCGSVLSTFFLLQSQLIRLNEEHKASISLSFLPQISGYIAGLVLVFVLRTPQSFFLGAIAGYLIAITLYLHPRFVFFGISKNLFSIKKSIKRWPPYLAIAFLSWLLGYGIVYVIDFFFTNDEIAIYVFLYTISSIIQLVGTSMNQVWSPRFFNDFNFKDVPRLEQEYGRFTLIQGITLGFVGSVLLLLLPTLGLISNSYTIYTDKGFNLIWLFMGYIVAIPWWHVQNYYLVNNRGYELMRVTVSAGILGLLAWFLLMKALGVAGIYFGFFINSLIRSGLVFISAKKYWNIEFDLSGQFMGILLLIGTIIIISGI